MVRLQQQANRGVHEIQFYAGDGALLLVAVNSRGVRVGQMRVYEDDAYGDAWDGLEVLLEAVDPVPHPTPRWTVTVPSPSLFPA